MDENAKEQEIIDEITAIDSELKRNWVIIKALKRLKTEREVDIGRLRTEARKV